MKITKEAILNALETITVAGEGKNMVEGGAVKNIIVFGRASYQLGGAGHVVLPLALAHEVLGAVRLVRVVRDVSVLLLAEHLVR